MTSSSSAICEQSFGEVAQTNTQPPSEYGTQVTVSTVLKIMKRYGSTFEEFCEKAFPPSKQEMMTQFEELILAGDSNYLTLDVVEATYGEGTFVRWLATQLAYHWRMLSKVVAMVDCIAQARTLSSAWRGIKCPEWMFFLVRARSGMYGSTFGEQSAASLGGQMKEHMKYRAAAMPRCVNWCRRNQKFHF